MTFLILATSNPLLAKSVVINILEVGAGTGCISEFIYKDIINAKLDCVQINYYMNYKKLYN